MTAPAVSPLAAMLAGVVDHRLDGAACAGRGELFDEQGPDEDDEQFGDRLAAASRICAMCRVLDRCRDVAAALPRSRRAGIWAGRAYEWGKK